MSFNLGDAFNMVIAMQGRDVVVEDLDLATSATVRAATSNYFRNMSGIEESVIEGKEFVFSVKDLTAASAPTLKRGVRIVDAERGEETITYVKPLIVMGSLVGYRVRTG